MISAHSGNMKKHWSKMWRNKAGISYEEWQCEKCKKLRNNRYTHKHDFNDSRSSRQSVDMQPMQ